MLNLAQFINADQYGGREALLNGEIGRVFGFRVIVSNLLADAEAYAYHRSCLAFASQKMYLMRNNVQLLIFKLGNILSVLVMVLNYLTLVTESLNLVHPLMLTCLNFMA